MIQSGDAHGAVTPAGADTLRGVCPVDGEPLEPVAVTPDDEIPRRVELARSAQEEWARRPLDKRLAALDRAAVELLRDRSRIVDLVHREIGKVDVDALFSEGLGPREVLKGWARVVRRGLPREQVKLSSVAFPGKRAFIDRVPRGVVGIIAPWNFPVAGLYRSVYPALLCGNGVVVKPSEHTPRSSAWFVEHLAPHLPSGLIQIVQGGGAAGAALVDAGVDAVVFTGSTRTGRKVSVRCAELGIPCSAEMGGNDAAIVFPDAELSRTTAGLTQWALQNAGQACGAIEVVYADRRIADRLVTRLVRAFQSLRVGPGPRGSVDVAPLATAAQLQTVEGHIDDARAKGAEVLCGGRRRGEGLSYEPTVVDRCTEDMDLVREETFGPVLAVCRVEGPTEAIRRVNRGTYGLTCSLWTQDLTRAERLAERVDVGVVTINNHALTGAIPELPWSGTRGSGFGVAGSEHALATFVRPRTLLVDSSRSPEPFWLPYDSKAWQLADLLADAQLFRLEGAWRLPGLMRQRIRAVRAFFE